MRLLVCLAFILSSPYMSPVIVSVIFIASYSRKTSGWMVAVANATRWYRRNDVVAIMAPIIITTIIISNSKWSMTSIQHRRGPPGPQLPPDQARCCSSSPWKEPAPRCHLPVIASIPWSIPTGRTLLIRRMIRRIAWNRTMIGCYQTVLPAHWQTISRRSGPIAVLKVWTRVRKMTASAKRPCRMVSRLCT